MNYCIVAFAIVMIVSVIQWFVDGRKNYVGPKVEIEDHVLVASESPRDLHSANTGSADDDEFGEKGTSTGMNGNGSARTNARLGAPRGGREEMHSTKDLADFLRDG